MTGSRQAVVIDASVAVQWVVQEPTSALADRLLNLPLVAPDLLAVECANVLWKKTQRGELSETEAVASVLILEAVPIAIVPTQPLVPLALRLAMERPDVTPAWCCRSPR